MGNNNANKIFEISRVLTSSTLSSLMILGLSSTGWAAGESEAQLDIKLHRCIQKVVYAAGKDLQKKSKASQLIDALYFIESGFDSSELKADKKTVLTQQCEQSLQNSANAQASVGGIQISAFSQSWMNFISYSKASCYQLVLNGNMHVGGALTAILRVPMAADGVAQYCVTARGTSWLEFGVEAQANIGNMPTIGGIEGGSAMPISFSILGAYERKSVNPSEILLGSIGVFDGSTRVNLKGSMMFLSGQVLVNPLDPSEFKVGAGLTTSLLGFAVGGQKRVLSYRILIDDNETNQQIETFKRFANTARVMTP